MEKEKRQRINKQFSDHAAMFSNLTKELEQNTEGAVVINIIISNDNSQLIVLLRESDDCMAIHQFSTADLQKIGEIFIEGNYIVATAIQQNDHGNLFAVPYLDTDTHYLCLFNRQGQLFDRDIRVSDITGIDKKVVPMMTEDIPLSVCCFTKQESLFYAFYDCRTNHLMYFTTHVQ